MFREAERKALLGNIVSFQPLPSEELGEKRCKAL